MGNAGGSTGGNAGAGGGESTMNTLAAMSAALGGNIGRQLLMGVPGMTEDVADAILDWIDEDNDPGSMAPKRTITLN